MESAGPIPISLERQLAQHVTKIICRSADAGEALPVLIQLLATNRRSSRVFLTRCGRKAGWKDLLLANPHRGVRSLVVMQLVLPCLKLVSPEEALQRFPPLETDASQSKQEPERFAVSWCMNSIIDMLKDVRLHIDHCDELLLVIKGFASLGWKERRFLLERMVITRLCCLVYGEDNFHSKDISGETSAKGATEAVPSPLSPEVVDGCILIDRFPRSAVTTMIEICSMLLRSTSPTQRDGLPDHSAPTHMNPSEALSLPNNDAYHFFHKPFFSCLLDRNVEQGPLIDVMIHFCWRNPIVSTNFVDLIVNGLKDHARKPHCIAFENRLGALDVLVGMRDDFSDVRTRNVLDHFLPFLQEFQNQADCARRCIQWLTTLMPDNETAMVWFSEHIRSLQEICQAHGWVLQTHHRWILKLKQ